tara:strand:- start:33 stop:371 length:339 start_codon:yes stop_codon:yes gene_type:complete
MDGILALRELLSTEMDVDVSHKILTISNNVSGRNIEIYHRSLSSYNKVEIVIADNGIGLKRSLASNPFVEVDTHSDAIQQALMPAISSKNYKGVKIGTNNPWHNSGFGLYEQ